MTVHLTIALPAEFTSGEAVHAIKAAIQEATLQEKLRSDPESPGPTALDPEIMADVLTDLHVKQSGRACAESHLVDAVYVLKRYAERSSSTPSTP